MSNSDTIETMLDKENSVNKQHHMSRHNSYKISGNLLASLDAVEI